MRRLGPRELNVDLFATSEVREFLERVKPKENPKMKKSGSGLGSYAKPVKASGGMKLLRLLTQRNKETLAGEHCIAASISSICIRKQLPKNVPCLSEDAIRFKNGTMSTLGSSVISM